MPNNLTDAEVKKALECCTTKGASCKDCPAFVKVDRSNCKKYFRGALDLINRQEFRIHQQEKTIMEIQNANLIDFKGTIANYKAENETLKAEIERLEKDSKRLKKTQMQLDDAMKMYHVIKAEAYKECLEKVEERIAVHLLRDKSNEYAEGFADALDGVNGELNNLLNELVGDGNGS